MRAKAAEPARNTDVSDQGWNPITNPAARELLDHLADELAAGYGLRIYLDSVGD